MGRSNHLNRAKAIAKRLSFDVEESLVPKEPPTKKTNWKCKEKLPRKFKFVDDGTFLSKLKMAVGHTRAGRDLDLDLDLARVASLDLDLGGRDQIMPRSRNF
jgi:hypothetical protein